MLNSIMKKPKSVRVLCEVHCNWTDVPPRYRLYVNGELFTERSYIWTDFYLEEAIHISALPGHYKIDYQLLDTATASLKIKNARVEQGPGIMHPKLMLEITP